MDSLPEAIVQYILSHLNNAKDVASCNCVSKRWKDSTPFIRGLYFPRNIFETQRSRSENPDTRILKMISFIVQLEELVVYCPFSTSGLVSWLSVASKALRHLELRMDNLTHHQSCLANYNPNEKLDSIRSACNLESLKLWGVLMIQPPKWDVFHNLRNLEIIGARFEDHALSDALRACPNLTDLMLLGSEGVRSFSIELKYLEKCKLDFYGVGNCLLYVACPKLTTLEVQGCSCIRVRGTQHLRHLTIANNSGRVCVVDFDELVALESLSLRGVQWSWNAISKMLKWASTVKHLFVKVEFTGDFEHLLPFPEIDFAEFFNSHPNLQKFDIHGAMFAALCQKNSLKNVDSGFEIPYLEEVVITVRSPLNAEQKMNTLESLLKYSSNLKKMVIKILQMKPGHASSDDFFEEVLKFRYLNRKIVRIE